MTYTAFVIKIFQEIRKKVRIFARCVQAMTAQWTMV